MKDYYLKFEDEEAARVSNAVYQGDAKNTTSTITLGPRKNE